eukprot:comp20992_c0_seq1/m.28142 comp20992_c0_seq1/g.28142  ORF comp20992_c0_seq1/g.28142 comp20992_c0_seq1/m.28142 type:complete len:676 (-) comp20992_c0_seq1:340-2367(-)
MAVGRVVAPASRALRVAATQRVARFSTSKPSMLFKNDHSYAEKLPIAGGSRAYRAMYRRSIANPDEFWDEMAKKHIHWERPYDFVNGSNLTEGAISWFMGGRLNASVNCIDAHLKTKADQVALIWEKDEPGQTEFITYHKLHAEVCKMANSLRRAGVRKYDVVTIYMPMMPQAVYAMLACARLGAAHSVVFAGFSAEGLASRINDANSTHVITADQGLRGGKVIELKKTVDEAVNNCPQVKHVLVSKRTGNPVPMKDGRDLDLDAEMADSRPFATAEIMDAEDLLFLLYTSGSTGKPKGLAHSTAGYLLYTSLTHKYVFDYRDGDIHACVADVGWITGHSYIVYGPLMNGATTVLFEPTPVYPNPSRYWEMVEKLGVTQFYTSPTALRMLIQKGDEWIKGHDLSSLRVLGSVGEPINPEAWNWYHEKVGGGRCTIVDTWWQTETGGAMITPIAGDRDLKPGAAMRPFFGVLPVLLDSNGQEIEGNDKQGILALKQIPPGMARTIYGHHRRYIETYLQPFPGYYYTGDGCRRDHEGHLWITGRVDDVINVSGHRIGTAEIEALLGSHPAVAEAAVVGVPHEIKGQAVFAYVTLMAENEKSEQQLAKELRDEIRAQIGGFAAPDWILIHNDLPKTRSGKIMRRILRKVAVKESDFGDISTLNDPSVVQALVDKRAKL